MWIGRMKIEFCGKSHGRAVKSASSALYSISGQKAVTGTGQEYADKCPSADCLEIWIQSSLLSDEILTPTN